MQAGDYAFDDFEEIDDEPFDELDEEDAWEDDDAGWREEGDGMSDVEADADTLRNVGWGTDEDYGYYGPDE